MLGLWAGVFNRDDSGRDAGCGCRASCAGCAGRHGCYTLAGYLLLASLGIGAFLAFLSPRLVGNFFTRWLTLLLFGWVTYSLTTYIEALIYTTYASASLYKVMMTSDVH